MSVITLSFGQCGNQIIQELYTTLYDDINISSTSPAKLNKDYVSEATKRWFSVTKHDLWLPRSILIDTDNKTTPIDNKNYKFSSVLSKSLGGCGNNWACGFCTKNVFFIDEIEEKLRKVFESDGDVTNILSLFSAGGGTGSGIGTKVLQHLHDCFPEKFLINCLIFPYNSGEIAVQSYNSLFTLSKLYDVTDGLILFENDRLQSFFKRSTCNVGFKQLNSVIAKQLAVAFQPIKDLQLKNLINTSEKYKLIQLSGGLIALEEFKNYETKTTWSVLMKEATVKMRCNKSFSDVLVSRGDDQPEVKKFVHHHQNRLFKNENRNLVLLSNNDSVNCVLNTLIEDAWKLFTHGAYLHHYVRYGVEEQCFLDAFERLERILYDYKNLE